jgi:glycosyltransferase involved in cell wall biosynthesis
MKLSILICSTHTRSATFLPVMMRSIFWQYDALTEDKKSLVEIIVLIDNKKMMLGEKRNEMVDMAQGEYVAFIDDDDRTEPDYISSLLSAIEGRVVDVITFLVSVSINNSEPKICRYSITYRQDHNSPTGYFRIPNHICCVRRSIAQKVSFPNIKYGEDSAYSKVLLPHLKSEYVIERVLYHYDFNEMTTETQEHIIANKNRNRPVASPPVVDVVILSNAHTAELRRLTDQTIHSCIAAANGLSVNIIVLEQAQGVVYPNFTTIHRPGKFNYNEFANFGARQGSAPWVMIANNDLIFKDGWLHMLLGAGHDVVSPKCPVDVRQDGMTENTVGTTNGVHFSGWCFMINRGLYNRIGGFDESVSFWCSDDAVIEQLKAVGVWPMIVPGAQVEHIQSSTLKNLPLAERDHLTRDQVKIFNKKYNQDKFNWGV